MKRLTGLLGLMLILLAAPLAFAGCEQAKQLGVWADTALTATDALVGALPADAPQVVAYQALRADLARFKADTAQARTIEEKLQLLVAFATITAEFNAIARPNVPPESKAGVALTRLDGALKSTARKLSCLLAKYPRDKLPAGTPQQLAAFAAARERLAIFAGE